MPCAPVHARPVSAVHVCGESVKRSFRVSVRVFRESVLSCCAGSACCQPAFLSCVTVLRQSFRVLIAELPDGVARSDAAWVVAASCVAAAVWTWGAGALGGDRARRPLRSFQTYPHRSFIFSVYGNCLPALVRINAPCSCAGRRLCVFAFAFDIPRLRRLAR